MLMCWARSEARSKTEAVNLFSPFGINQKYFLGHDRKHLFNRTSKTMQLSLGGLTDECKNTTGSGERSCARQESFHLRNTFYRRNVQWQIFPV